MENWVLITDDSKTIQMSLRSMLLSVGYESKVLSNFIEIPKLIRDNPPTLVLLDIEREGGLSGESIGNFINQYADKRIPIVIFSSVSEEKMESIKVNINANSFICKKSGLTRLKNEVESIVGFNGDVKKTS